MVLNGGGGCKMIEEVIGYLDLQGKMFKHKEMAISSSLEFLIMGIDGFIGTSYFSFHQVKKNRKKIIELLELLGEEE